MCIIYFTLEYVVRFACSPRKLRFLAQVRTTDSHQKNHKKRQTNSRP